MRVGSVVLRSFPEAHQKASHSTRLSRAAVKHETYARRFSPAQNGLGSEVIPPRVRSAPGGRLFPDQEYGLPGTRQAQFLAGQPLDGARVGAEGHDLHGQARVLGAELLDLPLERLGALALRDHAQDPAVSEEG